MKTYQPFDILLTSFAPALWGTTYIVTTEWLPAGYPLFIALMRALPIGIIMCLAFRQWPSGVWWWRSMVLGFLNIGFFFVLLFLAATRLPGGITATVGAIQPLIVIALAWSILKERPSLHSIGLAGLGIVGVGLLVFTKNAQIDRLGVLATCAATLAMACGTVLTKKWGQPVPILVFTAWQLVAGGVLLLPVVLILDGIPPNVTIQQGLGFLYLGAVNTGLAYALWFRGIKQLPTSTLPILGLLSPTVALLVGYFILHQRLSLPQLFGVALVLGSVLLSQFSTQSAKRQLVGQRVDGNVQCCARMES